MKVLVYGGVAVDPERVEEVGRAAAAFQAACREEEGCIDYLLSWDVAEPNRIRLVEVWESEETATAHTTQEHVKQWTTLVGGAAIEAPSFRRSLVPELEALT